MLAKNRFETVVSISKVILARNMIKFKTCGMWGRNIIGHESRCHQTITVPKVYGTSIELEPGPTSQCEWGLLRRLRRFKPNGLPAFALISPSSSAFSRKPLSICSELAKASSHSKFLQFLPPDLLQDWRIVHILALRRFWIGETSVNGDANGVRCVSFKACWRSFKIMRLNFF